MGQLPKVQIYDDKESLQFLVLRKLLDHGHNRSMNFNKF